MYTPNASSLTSEAATSKNQVCRLQATAWNLGIGIYDTHNSLFVLSKECPIIGHAFDPKSVYKNHEPGSKASYHRVVTGNSIAVGTLVQTMKSLPACQHVYVNASSTVWTPQPSAIAPGCMLSLMDSLTETPRFGLCSGRPSNNGEYEGI
jgi:hypothetical protein